MLVTDKSTWKSVRARFMIDTWAMWTMLSKDKIKELWCITNRLQEVWWAIWWIEKRPIYLLSLSASSGNWQTSNFDFRVVEWDMTLQEVDWLLARDILKHCHFIYDGERWHYTLSV